MTDIEKAYYLLSTDGIDSKPSKSWFKLAMMPMALIGGSCLLLTFIATTSIFGSTSQVNNEAGATDLLGVSRGLSSGGAVKPGMINCKQVLFPNGFPKKIGTRDVKVRHGGGWDDVPEDMRQKESSRLLESMGGKVALKNRIAKVRQQAAERQAANEAEGYQQPLWDRQYWYVVSDQSRNSAANILKSLGVEEHPWDKESRLECEVKFAREIAAMKAGVAVLDIPEGDRSAQEARVQKEIEDIEAVNQKKLEDLNQAGKMSSEQVFKLIGGLIVFITVVIAVAGQLIGFSPNDVNID